MALPFFIASLLCCGLPDARWVLPEQLHLALCFIGEVSGTAFLDIRVALAELAAAPFALRLQGVGIFPPRGQPRVVWAGINLQTAVEECLFSCNFLW
jgi:2'-5' RNA ligase